MANEILKRDDNQEPVIGLVTDDASKEIRMGRIDDTSKGLKVMLVGGTGSGTVTSISQGTGILLSTNPIVATGSVSLATSLQPIATLTGNSLKVLRVNAGETAVEYASVGAGTVTTVSVTTANGVSGSVATATTTPAITLTLGAITPTTTNGLTITANGTNTLNITAGKTLTVQDNVTITGALGTGAYATIANYLPLAGGTMTGDILGAVSYGATGTRITKLWATNVEITNLPTINGGTLATALSLSSYAPLASPTFSGTQTMTKMVQTVTAMGAQALDGTAGNVFTRTLGASETFTQSGFTAGQCFMVEVKQGSGTSYTVTWFAGVTWITSGATAPVQTTTTNGTTIYGFRCTGSNTFIGMLVATQ